MNNLLNTFLEISLYSSVIIIFTALLDKFTRKYYSSRWNYYIWLILAVRMLLPFNLQLVEIPNMLPAVRQVSIQKGAVTSPDISATTKLTTDEVTIDSEQITSTLSSSVEGDSSSGKSLPSYQKGEDYNRSDYDSVPILILLPYIWLAGIVIFLLQHIISYTVFLKKLKRWTMTVSEQETLRILSDMTSELKVQKTIKIGMCKYIFSPMMIGLLHPMIILPTEHFSENQMKTIIKHELIHYKHGDICYKLLLLCMNAIHWFNPFAFYMVKCANRTIELVCDEAVIAKQNEEYRESYSYALLQTIVKQQKIKYNAFSTNFNGGKKLMKERFTKIMSNSPLKKGILFFTLIFSLIILTGFVAAESKSSIGSKTALNNMKTAVNKNAAPKEKIINTKTSTEIKTDIILLAGVEDADNVKPHADTIILLTIQPESKNITITSFLRDMYVELPDGTKSKLNAAYTKGGIKLLEKTLEYNFGFPIDSTIEINNSGFENIIDLLGGVKITLTKKEADYLTHTNYISKPENRNVSKGEYILNGDQALGYVRIRKVENSNGIQGDFGRTERQRDLLLSICDKSKTADITTLLALADSVLSNVTTNLKKDNVVNYINTLLDPAYTTQTMQIPMEGTYEVTNIDGMSVLDIDITQIKKELNKFLQP